MTAYVEEHNLGAILFLGFSENKKKEKKKKKNLYKWDLIGAG